MDRQWKRVNGLSRCPICGKPDWCLISPDRSAVICPRVEEGSARYIDGSGYLHVLRVTEDWKDEIPRHRKLEPLPEHNEVLAIRARKFIADSTNEDLDELATELHVLPSSLEDLNVGYMRSSGAWAFPMLRAGKRLLGIRVRKRGGRKFSIKGSRNALFIPNSLNGTGLVYVCEGESDAAAMLSHGFQAIGRPSCNSGGRLIVELLKERTVVVCSDRDGVGRNGANQLVQLLDRHCPGAGVLEPPEPYNDMRDWIHEGGADCIRQMTTGFIIHGRFQAKERAGRE